MMNTRVLFQTSFYMLKKHKLRSVLTILGMAIGIAAMIITFSIGRGAEQVIRSQILSMGEQAVYIVPGNIFRRGRVKDLKPARLQQRDLNVIKKYEQFYDAIAPFRLSKHEVKYGDRSIYDTVIGTNQFMRDINQYVLDRGVFFNPDQVEKGSNVAILGGQTAKELFNEKDPIGKTIRIKNIPFVVIGVLGRLEHFWGLQDPNLRTLIPFAASKKYFSRKMEPEDDVGNIGLKVAKTADPGEVVRKIKRLLRTTHNLEEKELDDFTIYDQQSIERAARNASNVITLFGLIAASISLLVAGIGIMNIMLVSIQERIREIGIRLAIGATQVAIQIQFLLEAIVLSLLGGIAGVLLAITLQFLIIRFAGLPGHIELFPWLIGLATTVLIGVLFGFFPARRAASLNPIDALRK